MYEDDVIMPEGYEEGKDFFALGEEETAPEQQAETQDQHEAEPGEPVPPTTGSEPPEEAPGEASQLPTTEQPPTTGQDEQTGNKLKFTVTVDHSDTDVELDPAELPSVYQRAQVTDRVQQRLQQLQPRVDRAEQLARSMGYRDLDDMVEHAGQRLRDSAVEELVGDGMGRKAAEMLADVKFGQSAPKQEEPAPAAPSPTTGRDFGAEIATLHSVFPESRTMQQLPEEVLRECAVEGRPLVAAYAAWDARQRSAEADKLRKENETLRQNQQNAARAPVTGATGGGDTNQKPVDDFLKGFEDY